MMLVPALILRLTQMPSPQTKVHAAEERLSKIHDPKNQSIGFCRWRACLFCK